MSEPVKDLRLTARELDVLHLLATDKTPEEACETLSIEFSTWKAHVRSLYAKLAVRSRHGAVAKGFRGGWLF